MVIYQRGCFSSPEQLTHVGTAGCSAVQIVGIKAQRKNVKQSFGRFTARRAGQHVVRHVSPVRPFSGNDKIIGFQIFLVQRRARCCSGSAVRNRHRPPVFRCHPSDRSSISARPVGNRILMENKKTGLGFLFAACVIVISYPESETFCSLPCCAGCRILCNRAKNK
jgi:hypothetical protein